MRVLLLASGGIDSTTCWWILRDRGWHVSPLYVDFGQPAADREWEVLQTLARDGSAEPVRITVSPNPYADFPAYGLLPARNLMLLSLAVARAGAMGVRAVAIGSNADDAERGDGSVSFRSAVVQAASATRPRTHVIAPVGSLSKPAVVALARCLNVPIQATVSCYTSLRGGCGACRGCYDRRRSLATGEEMI